MQDAASEQAGGEPGWQGLPPQANKNSQSFTQSLQDKYKLLNCHSNGILAKLWDLYLLQRVKINRDIIALTDSFVH